MQGESAIPNSSVDDHHRRTVVTRSHLTFDSAEPQSLHDVDKDLWQWSFESVMAKTYSHSPGFSLSFSQYYCCLSGSDAGSLPHSLQTQVFPNQDTLNQYGFASPAESATMEAGLQSSPSQDITSAQFQESSKRFPCPDCRAYITDRKYNMKRHQQTVHGKRLKKQSRKNGASSSNS